MKIKVIIANDSDILFNSLSDLALRNGKKIEVINVPNDKLIHYIYKIKPKKNLIILDSITSAKFCINLLNNAIDRFVKGNITILVIDSTSIVNIINHEKNSNILTQKYCNSQILDILNLVSDSLNQTLEIEKDISTVLWKMGLTSCFKGTTYLKDAVLLAYTDKKLLSKIQILVKKVAQKNNVLNDNLVRSDMDKALNSVLDLLKTETIYEIFGDLYDGRKISLSYFIDLCIRHLEYKRYCCFN